jgi:alkaline phosphatase D
MQKRQLLKTALAAATGPLLLSHAWAGRGSLADPFALGVASGAPHDHGMVLWTRIAPAALPSPLSPVDVRWQIADDESFKRPVASGQAAALPHLGHSVHVEVTGLQPGRWYFYRFLLGDATSDIGRTRTAPVADSQPEHLRFAFASCQRWEGGFYAAWRDAAAQSPDLIVFLGDYIYEYASSRNPAVPPPRSHTLAHAVSLADYRDRYALYKSDPDLQAAHKACPWIVTWDDHEVENDYAATHGRTDPVAFAARRAAAYQAFYENMPLPASALVRGLAGLGAPDAVRVTQRFEFGRLASFHLLDTRQFRDLQACREETDQGASANKGTVRPADCPALQDPTRSLLGAAQENWLDAGLQADADHGRTRWTVLAQQTLFTPRHYGGANAPVVTDTWDGYPAARQRMLDSLTHHKPRNTVLIGGDIHQNYVCNVANADRPDAPLIATEFCGTSISSPSSASASRIAALMQQNPNIVMANAERRGYALVDVTLTRWTTTLRTVDQIENQHSSVSTQQTFEVRDTRAGIA